MNDTIIMCHGHKHRKPVLPHWIPDETKKTLIDINKDVEPDIVADFMDLQSILDLGREICDVVIEQYSPIYGVPRNMMIYLCNLYHLLRPGGEMIILFNKSILKHCRLPTHIEHLGEIRTRRQIDELDNHLFEQLYHDGKLEIVDDIIRYIMEISKYQDYHIRGKYLIFVK